MKKLYYSIGEISEMLSEEQHILRHWEKTFSVLSPKKNSSGVRVYNDNDILTLRVIKHLLRVELLSIKKAKELLVSRKSVNEYAEKHFVSDKEESSPNQIQENVTVSESKEIKEDSSSIKPKLDNSTQTNSRIGNNSNREIVSEVSESVNGAQRDELKKELFEIKDVLNGIKNELLTML